MGTFTQMAESWIQMNQVRIIASLEPSPYTGTLPQVELLPAEVRQWDDTMHAWTQARCAWRERSWGAVSSLYVDHIAWAHQTGQDFAPDRDTFTAILESLSFAITGDMVYGLLLKEDVEAAMAEANGSIEPWRRQSLVQRRRLRRRSY